MSRLRGILLVWALLLAAAAAWARKEERPPSLLIRGGTVVDGTGAPRRRADVRVDGDRIAAVGRLRPRPGERLIEAAGLVVAPGFIDTHSHADAGLEEAPEAESQVRQGITTAVIGQDGGSHLPLRAYFDALRRKPAALNLASFAGHGAIRRQVMGNDFRRAATAEETARMAALVEREMADGALGLSTGLEYDPAFYAETAEIVACARASAAAGGLHISHARNEDTGAFAAFEELLRVAREARAPTQVSHIKLGAKSVWGRAGEALRLLDEAGRRGPEVTADVYPYTYWQSTITVLIPSRDWEERALWEKGLENVGGPGNVLLALYTPDPSWQGKSIAAIAAASGRDPVSVIQEIVRRTRAPGASGREAVVVTAMAEEDLRRFIASPRVMFCSDGGPRTPHPRGAGAYPRLLGRYVREQRLLTLEEAVRKMTSFPARRMGLKDRGVVRPTLKADLVLFDPERVLDRATVAEPKAHPDGILHVLVNGVPVLENGRVTGALPGLPLKRARRKW